MQKLISANVMAKKDPVSFYNKKPSQNNHLEETRNFIFSLKLLTGSFLIILMEIGFPKFWEGTLPLTIFNPF